MQIGRDFLQPLIGLAKLRIVFIEAVFCSLAGLIAWTFTLGADPRVDGEDRHFIIIVASVSIGFALGLGLFFTGRFRSSPWLYVRAAQLACAISLLQLAAQQHTSFIRTAAGATGAVVLTTCLVAASRVLINARPNRMLDVLLVYGSLAGALIFAGAFHSRIVSLTVEFEEGVGLATLESRHLFAQLVTETNQLHGVQDWERSSSATGGTGIRLNASGGESLLVVGDESRFNSLCRHITLELNEFLQNRNDTFRASESHLNLFWGYAITAVMFLIVGWTCDSLCRPNFDDAPS